MSVLRISFTPREKWQLYVFTKLFRLKYVLSTHRMLQGQSLPTLQQQGIPVSMLDVQDNKLVEIVEQVKF